MSTPCAQENSIEAIIKTLDRMEKGQERVVDLLEKVANQDAKIEHLQEAAERTYNDVNELFARMRDAEMNAASSGPSVRQQFHDTIDMLDRKLDKLNQFFNLTTSRPAIITYGTIVAMITIGTFCDIMYHFETFKAFYHFIKG